MDKAMECAQLCSKFAAAVKDLNEHYGAASNTTPEKASHKLFANLLQDIFPVTCAGTGGEQDPSAASSSSSATSRRCPITVEHTIALCVHVLCVMGSHLDRDDTDSQEKGRKPSTNRAQKPGLGYTCRGNGEDDALMMSSLPNSGNQNRRKSAKEIPSDDSSYTAAFMRQYGRYLPPSQFQTGEHTYTAAYELNKLGANIKVKVGQAANRCDLIMFRPVQADFLMTHVVVQQSSAIEQHARCVKTSSDAESSLDELLENKENTNILSADMIQRLVDNLSVESRHAEESQETAHAHHAHHSDHPIYSGEERFVSGGYPITGGGSDRGGGLHVGPSNPCFTDPFRVQPGNSLHAPPRARYDPMTPWDTDRRGIGDRDIDRPSFPHGGNDVI